MHQLKAYNSQGQIESFLSAGNTERIQRYCRNASADEGHYQSLLGHIRNIDARNCSIVTSEKDSSIISLGIIKKHTGIAPDYLESFSVDKEYVDTPEGSKILKYLSERYTKEKKGLCWGAPVNSTQLNILSLTNATGFHRAKNLYVFWINVEPEDIPTSIEFVNRYVESPDTLAEEYDVQSLYLPHAMRGSLKYTRQFRNKNFVISFGKEGTERNLHPIMESIVYLFNSGIRPIILPADNEQKDEMYAILYNHGINAVSGNVLGIPSESGQELEKDAIVRPEFLASMINRGDAIPIIPPRIINWKGEQLDRDIIASEIALAGRAKKLIYLTDTEGILIQNCMLAGLKASASYINDTILRKQNNREHRISYILSANASDLLGKEGVITGGMRYKVSGCIKAVEHGVERSHIINGLREDSLLLELFTEEGLGTMIVEEEEVRKYEEEEY